MHELHMYILPIKMCMGVICTSPSSRVTTYTISNYVAGLHKKICVKLLIFSYPSVVTYVLGAQKNRLIERILLSTHNICFG